MSAFLTVAGKLVSLFIYILVGYFIRRFDVISREFASGISRFLMRVTLPCLILITFQTDYTSDRLLQAGQTYFFSVLAYAASIAAGYLSFRLFRIDEKAKGVWVYSVVFPNQAFMGWPVIAAVFGDDALFYATFANMAFASFAYTYGVWLMRSTGTMKDKPHSFREDFLTPINIAILAGLLLFFTQLRIPVPVNNAVRGIADLTTPLAMIFVGTILAGSPLRTILADRRVYLVSVLRLVFIPGIALLLLRPLGLQEFVLGATVLSLAMPVAGFAAIYAGAYGNDVELASKFVSVSSLLSVFTIPIFALLL